MPFWFIAWASTRWRPAFRPSFASTRVSAAMTSTIDSAAASTVPNVVSVASGGTGDVYSPATGTWTETGPMVFPYASAAAALLPNGQVLYAGGERFYCGVKNCFYEPSANAELYTP